MRLKGKTALVTGAGHGIGKATALLFAKEGADIAVNDIDLSAGEETADAVKKIGCRSIAIKADVSEPNDVDIMVDKVIKELGGIHIVVNNAGVPPPPVPMIDIQSMEAWDKISAVIVRGTFLCSQRAARWMRYHNGGAIVSISSIAGVTGLPEINSYGPSKAGVINLTKALAIEWAQYNIRVNCIVPSWVRTTILDKALEEGKISMDAINKRTPMGRPADPEEIAKAALFLASDEASYITGAALPVDGGWLALGF